MVIENKKRSIITKRIFYFGSLFVIAAAVLIYFDQFGAALISGGVFALWILFFQFADYQYVEFSDDNGLITFRYYPIAKFGKKQYSTIEFSPKVLHEARFDSGMFGLFSELNLAVKTKRGIAEYPAISLTAVSKSDRKRIEQALDKILSL